MLPKEAHGILSGTDVYGPFPDPVTAAQWAEMVAQKPEALNMFLFEKDAQTSSQKAVFSVVRLLWPPRLR